MTHWKTTLPCNRAEAAAAPFADAAFADLDDPPTLLVDEPDPARPDDWVLALYTDAEPDAALLARLAALAPSRRGAPVVEALADADWTTLSQADLAPVRAGRFLVHTSAHAAAVRAGDIALEIEAGLAFGTGQHATTLGCLAALDKLARTRRFAAVADIGTGTAVLALAAAKRWRGARVIASDIDPVSVVVARGNVRANAVRRGRGRGQIELFVAAGLAHPRLHARRFDLVTANILAGPLVAMAADIAKTIAPGGILVLAGLLDSQARRVRAAYAARGLRPLAQHTSAGEWPVLVLRRPVTAATRGTAAYRRGW